MNTVIIESTEEGDVQYDVFSKLISDRIIFLSDYIDDGVATNVVATLLYLNSIDSESPISIYINSESGDIRSVLMIYDVMQLVSCPIQTVCLGAATFESAIILAAGTPGKRAATKSSNICVSQLSADGFTVGDMTDIRISYDQMKKDNNKIINILAKHTGKTVAKLRRDCERKVFMTPLQAKRYGIIDLVLEWKK